MSLVSLTSCISISSVNEEFKSFAGKKDISANAESKIELLSKNEKICIEQEQKSFLIDKISKYFEINPDEKVKIKIFEKSDQSEFLTALNVGISLATLTVVPIYGAVRYEIEVKVIGPEDRARVYTSTFSDEGLASVLALPFVFEHGAKHVRRNNLEAAIYRASTKETTGVAEKKTILKLACATKV